MTWGCHNKPRPTADTTYQAQDGWLRSVGFEGQPTRLPRIIQIRHTMSTECQYSKTTADAKCTGCDHNQGEKSA